MLAPKLIHIAWILVLVHAVLIILSSWGWDGERHRVLAAAFRLAPWVFPVVCIAAFMLASHLDRRNAEHLRASGVVAVATVLNVHDSGIELGVDPVLTVRVRVTPANAEPFESEVAVVPSRLDMGRVREGTQLRVRYDPNHRDRITVEAITSVTIP